MDGFLVIDVLLAPQQELDSRKKKYRQRDSYFSYFLTAFNTLQCISRLFSHDGMDSICGS